MKGDRARCSAHRGNGDPCKNAPLAGTNVCRVHGGSAPQVRKKAQERIAMAADPAAAKLVELMQDKTVPHAIQLAAARDLLDRAGISRTATLGLEIRKYEELVESGALLIDLDIEAEVVDMDVDDRDWVERVDGPPSRESLPAPPAPRRRENVRYKGKKAPR